MTSEGPTFSLPLGFLGIECNDHTAAICIAGIPFDIGTTNRSGARFGPQAIRHASRMLRDGAHPRTFADPLALSLADIGNFRVALGDIPATTSLIERQAREIAHLIAFGGDHGVTLPLLRALARRIGCALWWVSGPGSPALQHARHNRGNENAQHAGPIGVSAKSQIGVRSTA